MASPFPGMDPYIEHPNIWSDFHHNLASEIQGMLNPVIRPKYVARIVPVVTYELIEVAETKSRMIRPDVGIYGRPIEGEPQGNSAVITPPPEISRVLMEMPLQLATIEIRLVETMELVTAIEILSPVNKKPGHDAHHGYLKKWRELFRSDANLLEIDFLRGGERPPLETDVREAPYYAVLSRANNRPSVEVWPVQLSDTLPVLPVPLRDNDLDIALDMGAALNTVYERGGYGDIINYSDSPPPPRLREDEKQFVERIVRSN